MCEALGLGDKPGSRIEDGLQFPGNGLGGRVGEGEGRGEGGVGEGGGEEEGKDF